MTSSQDNRSSIDGLLGDAKKKKKTADKQSTTDEATAGQGATDTNDATPATAPSDRIRRSVYAAERIFERVHVWSTFLDASKAEIFERALDDYCDRLAEAYNDGNDPVVPKSEDSQTLL
jgi:hypothetical protein